MFAVHNGPIVPISEIHPPSLFKELLRTFLDRFDIRTEIPSVGSQIMVVKALRLTR
jgi:hypothetical protein